MHSGDYKNPLLSPYLAPAASQLATGSLKKRLQSSASSVSCSKTNKSKNKKGTTESSEQDEVSIAVNEKKVVTSAKHLQEMAEALRIAGWSGRNDYRKNLMQLVQSKGTSGLADYKNSELPTITRERKSKSSKQKQKFLKKKEKKEAVANDVELEDTQSNPIECQPSQNLPDSVVGDCLCDPNIKLSEEMSSEMKLKSILKTSSSRNFFHRGVQDIKSVKRQGDGENTSGGLPNKKVHFYDRVEVHPVPYESRGSTEWQHNILMTRENIMNTLFSDYPMNYLNGGLSQARGFGYPSYQQKFFRR